jgi:hypothetical protein
MNALDFGAHHSGDAQPPDPARADCVSGEAVHKLGYTLVHSRGVVAEELAGGLDAGHQQRATENATAEKRENVDPHRESLTGIIRQKTGHKPNAMRSTNR